VAHTLLFVYAPPAWHAGSETRQEAATWESNVAATPDLRLRTLRMMADCPAEQLSPSSSIKFILG
jgi:hypothetical protein